MEEYYRLITLLIIAAVTSIATGAPGDGDCKKQCLEKAGKSRTYSIESCRNEDCKLCLQYCEMLMPKGNCSSQCSLAANFSLCNETCTFLKKKIRFHTSEVRKPTRPRDFKTNGAWFQGDRIFVNVTWSPPLVIDLPVRRYRLIYKKHVHGTGQHYDPVREMRKKVGGTRTHVVLPRLLADTIYIVKIQALLNTGRRKIKGKWATLLIKTPPLLTPTVPNTSALPALQPISLTPLPTATLVTIQTAINFFCRAVFINPDGYLSAALRWTVPETVVGIQIAYKPDKCKNWEHLSSMPKKEAVKAEIKELVLTNLYPACAYTVKMTPYYANHRKADKEQSLSFSTDISDSKSLRTTVTKLKSKQPKVPSDSSISFFSYFSFLLVIFNLFILIL